LTCWVPLTSLLLRICCSCSCDLFNTIQLQHSNDMGTATILSEGAQYCNLMLKL
jgi:hypothetical protein